MQQSPIVMSNPDVVTKVALAASNSYQVARALAGPTHRSGTVDAEIARRWLAEPGRMGEICRHAMLPSGKLFRPVLLIEAALAVGGQVAAVLPAAVGTECGHVASLIHDDIIDGDDMRRGRPSVPAQYGIADAIVAGDLLLFQLFECLAQCFDAGVSATRVVAALRTTARAGVDLCLGQSLEAELTGRLDCREDEYLEMVRLKTGALFRGSCEVGGLLGGGTGAQVAALSGYGNHLGIAFQICDDLLGYTSDPATTGKAATSDLRNRRLTLPIILLLCAAGPAERRLVELAFAGAFDEREVQERLAEALDRLGVLDEAAAAARRHCAVAVEHLELLPETPSRETLRTFARLAVERAC